MPVVTREPVGQDPPLMTGKPPCYSLGPHSIFKIIFFDISCYLVEGFYNNILKYTKEIYTEFSKIAKRIHLIACQIHIHNNI